MFKELLLPILATFTFSVEIQAEEIFQQQKTIVTASRYEQAITDVIPSTTIIERADILNSQANSIMDVLSLQQGIDVARSGGKGSQTSIFMRGTNSNHTLVLINGMRVGSSFTGSFAWENLPVSQIERVEIVRGTRVSFYGSDAIGGVINIITRSDENKSLRYTLGSYDTHNFDYGLGHTSDSSSYNLVISSQKTDGFSATNENNLYGFNPDKDGSENQSINFNTSHQINDGQLNFNILKSESDTDFDTGNTDTQELVARLSWKNTFSNGWGSELALGNNYNKIATKAFSSIFDSQRYSFDWLLNKQINNNHFSYGLVYRKEQAEFINPNATEVSFSNDRNNIAVFANWNGVFNKNVIASGFRYDENNVYGSNLTADLDWAFNFSEQARISFSIGSAFHAPSISELYSPNFQGFVISPISGESSFAFAIEGNSDLKPEESINYELGLKTNLADNHHLSFNLFYYKVDNLVDFQGFTFKPVNVNQATINGLEVEYKYSYENLSFNANATIQNANNDESDTPLLRRPDKKFNMSIDKFFNKASIGSSVRYASKNPDFGVALASYTIIDIRAAYKLNSHWKVSAKIENSLDKQYQIINGYNTPDLSGYLTIEWQQ